MATFLSDAALKQLVQQELPPPDPTGKKNALVFKATTAGLTAIGRASLGNSGWVIQGAIEKPISGPWQAGVSAVWLF